MKHITSSKASALLILALTALTASACAPASPTDGGTDSGMTADSGTQPADGSLIDSAVIPADVGVSVDTGSNAEAATPPPDAAADNG